MIHFGDPGTRPEEEWAELRTERERRNERWELRSAQWRALLLARFAFGEEASTELSGLRGRGAFRGLIHLAVPFRSLPDHRRRERVFREVAARDPVLSQVRCVYVFDPIAVEVG